MRKWGSANVILMCTSQFTSLQAMKFEVTLSEFLIRRPSVNDEVNIGDYMKFYRNWSSCCGFRYIQVWFRIWDFSLLVTLIIPWFLYHLCNLKEMLGRKRTRYCKQSIQVSRTSTLWWTSKLRCGKERTRMYSTRRAAMLRLGKELWSIIDFT